MENNFSWSRIEKASKHFGIKIEVVATQLDGSTHGFELNLVVFDSSISLPCNCLSSNLSPEKTIRGILKTMKKSKKYSTGKKWILKKWVFDVKFVNNERL